MADTIDDDIPHAGRLSDEQRKLIEEKVRLAKEHKQAALNSIEQSATSAPVTPQNKLPEHVAVERNELKKQVEARRKLKQHLQKLRKHLLSMAGKDADIDDLYPYNDMLMESGQAWNSLEVNMITGPESSTDRSVARLWQQSPAYYNIAAGYALDAAGVWHKHAWLIAQRQVQELKLKHAVYYGVLLTAKQSEVFAMEALQ